jgi:hypothetical protein
MTQKIKIIRIWLGAFIIILFLSGVTAIPIDAELSFLIEFFPTDTILHKWLEKVLIAYREVSEKYPFLLYGYDWLAFAHFVLAILFIGPYRDPVKNIWVLQFGLIACVLVLPLAFIAGHFRGIPIGWQIIDCSFGVFGFIPLWICYRKTIELIKEASA